VTTSYLSNALNQYWRSETAATQSAQGFRYDDDGNLVDLYVAADMNCDGTANVGDIICFSAAVQRCPPNPPGYPCDPCDCLNGDLNGDGWVTFADINLLMGFMGFGASRAAYTWDGENRLIQAGPAEGGSLDDGAIRVSFAYDYLGRRVRKVVETYDAGSQQWQVTATRKFVWSGWRMLLEMNEVDEQDQVLRKYTWGLDLAGQSSAAGSEPGASATGLLEGAGTIGGLLAIEEPLQIRDVLNYVYLYDANGNAGQLVEWRPDLTTPPGTWSAARLVAHYEYDPYGNVTAQSGTYGGSNPFRFSTKYFDPETGFYYFGYRYYSPTLGRWIGRDPVEEGDGANLYVFVGNVPTGRTDTLGLFTGAIHKELTYYAMRRAGGTTSMQLIAKYNVQTDTAFFFDESAHAQAEFRPLLRSILNLGTYLDCSPPEQWIESMSRLLGLASHILQDFYAHTDWVEGGTPQMIALYKRHGYLVLANRAVGGAPHGPKQVVNLNTLSFDRTVWTYKGWGTPGDSAHNQFAADKPGHGRARPSPNGLGDSAYYRAEAGAAEQTNGM
jgi:RHS repeat-associated protein